MTINVLKLSSTPVEGTAYKSNLSAYKGSVYGGTNSGTFNGFKEIANWVYEYVPTTGQLTVWREDFPDTKETVFTNVPGIKELSFTFDKQMLYVVTYIKLNSCYLYYFDSSLNRYTTIEIENAKYPKVALNTIHFSHIADSDVVLGYIKDKKKLCVRLQRERYTVEHVIKEFKGEAKLYNIGYADTNRFQYEVLESVA